MPSVMEIIVSAQDQASGVLEGIGDSAEDTADGINVSWAAVGAGMTAAGAGAEAFARSQQDTNVQTRQLAATLDVSESAMRDMANETSNVTFPLNEVLDLMETGRERGLESADALQEYATFWDTVGDATGESATQLGKAGAALAAVGIEAGNEAEAMSALGFVHQETTGSVSDFLAFLDRTGPELREMGADVDDAAAVLGVMERELGMTGRTARSEFRSAVSEADGDMGKLLDTLGISEDSFNAMRSEVDASSDVIDRNAGIVADSFTPLQRLSHGAEEMIMQYGGLADMAGVVAVPLLALGPIITGLSVASRGLGAAMTFLAANPIVLIIAAVVAATAALVIAYRESEQFREVVQAVFGAVGEGASWLWDNVLGPVFDGITGGFGWVMRAAQDFGGTWDSIMRGAGAAVSLMTAPWRAGFNAVGSGIESVVNTIASGVNGLPSFTIPDWVPRIGGSTFGLPHFPSISIPRLHDGGVFRAPAGQSEGLALLRDEERVTTPEQDDDMVSLLARMVALLERGIPVDVTGTDEEMKRLIRKLFRTAGLAVT